MKNVIQKLPHHLKGNVFMAGEEPAWPKHAALEVIEFCMAESIAVLGGEVWVPTDPGPTIPTPYIYTWETDKQLPSETWPEFVRRSGERATKYVREFSWHPSDAMKSLVPVFNLSLSDQEEYCRLASL